MHESFIKVDLEPSLEEHIRRQLSPMLGVISVVMANNNSLHQSIGNCRSDIFTKALGAN